MAPEEQPPQERQGAEEATPRSIRLEAEVAGTPEEVWEAIATGRGISAWLHPTEVTERAGGRFTFDLGVGAVREGTVTAWDPPRRFAQETAWDPPGEACRRPGWPPSGWSRPATTAPAWSGW